MKKDMFESNKLPTKLTRIGVCALLFVSMSMPEALSQEVQNESVKEENPATISWPDLQSLGKAYRVNPTSSSWLNYINAFKSHVKEPLASKSTGSQIIKANPSLKDFRVQIFNAGGGRIWHFPNATGNRVLYLQIGQALHQIDYDDNVNISGAKIVRSVITTTKVVRTRRRRRVRKRVVKVSGPQYLILAGTNRINGTIWLKSYKPYDGRYVPTFDPFSQIPPYLLKNVSGQVSFSGNNIVMAVSASDKQKDSKLPKPNSTSYRIVLTNSAGKYHLAGSSSSNQPVSIITQFVNSIRNNRIDLAKAWLHEPDLVSIPKYIGLVGTNKEKPFKLVTMAQPKHGGPRYRLVTYQKHDLIIDVGKKRGRLAIKGLFIAPPDPLSKKLQGVQIGSSPAPTPPATQ